MTEEIKYRQRTDTELENMRQDLIKKRNIISLCIYSENDSCDPYCSKFKNCWKDDYSSPLENKI